MKEYELLITIPKSEEFEKMKRRVQRKIKKSKELVESGAYESIVVIQERTSRQVEVRVYYSLPNVYSIYDNGEHLNSTMFSTYLVQMLIDVVHNSNFHFKCCSNG